MADNTTPWIGVSQYKTAKQYGPKEPLCTFSRVMPGKVMYRDKEHNGIVTHACTLPLKHEGLCKCDCGEVWKGYTL